MTNKLEAMTDTMVQLVPLTHMVQHNDGHGWRTIAAFDVEVVAKKYARDCAATAKLRGFDSYKYRVRKI